MPLDVELSLLDQDAQRACCSGPGSSNSDRSRGLASFLAAFGRHTERASHRSVSIFRPPLARRSGEQVTTQVTTASDLAGPGETCSDATPGLAFANQPQHDAPNGTVLHGIQKL